MGRARRQDRREQRQEDRQQFGRGGTAERYQMRQKLVSFGDDFWIESQLPPAESRWLGKRLKVA